MIVTLRVLTVRTSLHTYIYSKYTYIKNHITDTLVYQPVLCTLTLVCALVSAHTYNTSLHTDIHKYWYTYIVSWIVLFMNPRCANTHICLCPCDCSQLEALVYIDSTHKLRISYTDTFVYWLRAVRTHICLCPCECSQLEPLCIHTYVTCIHIFHHRYVGISTCAVHSHTCLCPCECSHLQPVCIQIFTSISVHTSYHG